MIVGDRWIPGFGPLAAATISGLLGTGVMILGIVVGRDR
jgi:hypothetical protein